MFSKLIVKVFFLAGLCCIAVNGYCEVAAISAEKANEMLAKKERNLTIVDVRGGYDFQKGHILGAVNFAYNTIDKAGLPKDVALLLYCGNDKCPLSHLAAKTLETLGYKDLMVLEGGIAAWTAKGYAIKTSAGIQQKKAAVNIASMPAGKLYKRLADKAIGIIDLRPAKDFRIAHVQGAKSVPLETLEDACSTLPKDKEWVVYDSQSGRAKTGAQLLAQKDLKVKELSGGIQVWAAKKYPMESGEAK